MHTFHPLDLQSRDSAEGLIAAPKGVPDKAGGSHRASLPWPSEGRPPGLLGGRGAASYPNPHPPQGEVSSSPVSNFPRLFPPPIEYV